MDNTNYYGYIYLTYDQKTKKVYVGQKSGKVEDSLNYYGSGTLIVNIINSRGTSFLKKRILGFCDSKEKLNESEKECIKFYNSNNKLYGYNLTEGGDGVSKGFIPWNKGLENYGVGEDNNFYNHKHKEETKNDIAYKAKIRHENGEYEYSNFYKPIKKGSSYVESFGEITGNFLKQKRSEEAKQRHEDGTFWKDNKNPFEGRHHTEAAREQQSISAKKRKPPSEETRLKISKKSLERSDDISKRNSGINNGRSIKIDIDLILKLNKDGKTNKEIANELNVDTRIIKKRLSNPDKWKLL